MYPFTKSSLPVALIGVCLLSTGCASQKQLQEYQNEVRSLREERTQLKKENAALRAQAESYEVALAEASHQLANVPESPSYGQLDEYGIGYGVEGGNFVISIPSSVTFAAGKAELTREGREALAAVAKTLQSDYGDGVYWIEGHTDSDPIRKSKWGSNRELSVARAMAVLTHLVESCGLSDDKCVVAGHGQYRSVASNNDDAGKAKNRRVNIVVHPGQ